MLQNKKLVIYPTSRCIREKIQEQLLTDSILPKLVTIGEFEKKSIIVKDRVFIDQDTRIQILNEASAFSTFTNLHIDREFFAFLKNSKFLFSFFDELSVELVDITTLASYDTYASFSEHIEILETLLAKYIKLLSEKKYVDKITLPSLYEINHAYLKSFDEIELHLEGYLNNFEFKLFCEISEIVPINLHITTNKFNTKMANKFKELDIELEIDHQYIINLSQKSITYSLKNQTQNANFHINSCENQITQVAYIKKRIYDYIQMGIEPKKIIVILPNSKFSKYLDIYDDENNFNFAMGFSYKTTLLYQKLSAIYDYYTDRDIEGKHRLLRLDIDIEKLKISYELWNKKQTPSELTKIFNSLVEDKEDEISLIYHEELHIFSKLFKNLQHQPFHKILHLFLNRLSTRTIDDTRGGKITVMEVLETRGVKFDAVVLVDFNEGVVPISSQKDMFLSSELRYFAALPTSIDRENLQKYYYKRVFDNAKEVSISYVEDEQNQPSRFLDELNIPTKNEKISELSTIMFDIHRPKIHYQQEDLILKYDFSKHKLSSTALKTYLDCKRAYYFKYIKKIQSVEIPKEDSSDRKIGILIHEALKLAYKKKSSYFSSDELHYEIQSYLYQESEKEANLRFLVDIWLLKLKPFIENEIKRANDGYKAKYIEESFKLKIDDFTIIGEIDRIDEKDNYLEVVDYKSGKIPKDSQKSLEKTSNFQLQFYHLLASQKGEVKESYYYDLNNGLMVEDSFFDTKLDMLYKIFDELKAPTHNFSKTDELKKCIYCPYIKICDRIV